MPRKVTLTFEDGSQHIYDEVPDSVKPTDIESRAAKQFADRKLVSIKGEKVGAKAAKDDGGLLTPEAQRRLAIAQQSGEIPTRMPIAEEEPTGLAALKRPAGEVAAGLFAGAAAIPETIGSHFGVLEKGRTEEIFRQLMGIPQDSDAFGAGEFVGETAATMALPMGAARLTKAIPGVASSPYLNKLLTAVETGGFGKMAGAPAGSPLMTRSAQAGKNYLTRVAGGGIGGGLTGALLQGDVEGAEQGALMGAAIPGALSPAGQVAVKAGKGIRALAGKTEDLKAADKAKLVEVAGSKINDLIAELESAPDVVPGYQPQAGEAAIRAQAPGFASLVKNVLNEAKVDNDVAAVLADRDASNQLAMKMYQDGLVKSVDDAKKMLSQALPKRQPEELGGILAGRRKEIIQAEKDKIDPLYAAARAHRGSIDATELGTIANQIRSRHTQFGSDLDTDTLALINKLQPTEVPGGYNKLTLGFDAPKVMPPSISMKEAIELDKRLGREQALLKKSTIPGSREMLFDVGNMKKQLDSVIKKNVPEDVYQSYVTGKSQYQKQVIEPFYESEFEKIAKKGAFGQPRMQPSDIVKRAFAKPEFAQQFVRQFRNDPDAVSAATEGIEELFRKNVMRDDAIDLNLAKKFLEKNADSLNVLEFGGVPSKSKLKTLVANAEATDNIATTVQQNAKLLGEFNPQIATAERQAKIAQLTQGLTPAQMRDVDAIRKTVDRTKEFERLASFGKEEGEAMFSSRVAKMPPMLKTWATVVRALETKLGAGIDQKKLIELAKTFIEPKVTAQALRDAKAWQAAKQAKLERITAKGEALAAAGRVGGMAITAATQNKLAQDRNQNALMR